MKKSKKPRPVVPCWNCGSSILLSLERFMTHDEELEYAKFNDVRDIGWHWCKKCGATAQEKPTSLGQPIKGIPQYTKTMPLLQQCINPSGRIFQHESVRYMPWDRKQMLTMKILKDWGCDLQHIAGVKFPSVRPKHVFG